MIPEQREIKAIKVILVIPVLKDLKVKSLVGEEGGDYIDLLKGKGL